MKRWVGREIKLVGRRRRKYRNLIGIIIMMDCLVLSSCVTRGPIRRTSPPPASYTDAEVLFLRGEFVQAAYAFETFIARNPRSPYVSDAHYWAGICALKLDNVKKARKHIARAHARPRTPLLSGLAQTALGDCDYQEGKFASAAAKYRKAAVTEGTQRARILYQMGMCYNRIGKLRDAKSCFEKTYDEYPNTQYAELAREKLKFTGSAFSVQVGAFDRKENAEALRSRLAMRNFSPHIQIINRGGKTLYCVRVGHFEVWKQADEASKKLKDAGFDTVVIP